MLHYTPISIRVKEIAYYRRRGKTQWCVSTTPTRKDKIMSKERKQELNNRLEELLDKYKNTKSMSLKGYYVGEMAWINQMLAKAEKE